MKYRNHPSINTIRHFSQRYSTFYFSEVGKNAVLKEIRRLSTRKAVQETDIPVIIITVGKFQRFDWLGGAQLIINFCVTKEKHTLRTSRITKCEK